MVWTYRAESMVWTHIFPEPSGTCGFHLPHTSRLNSGKCTAHQIGGAVEAPQLAPCLWEQPSRLGHPRCKIIGDTLSALPWWTGKEARAGKHLSATCHPRPDLWPNVQCGALTEPPEDRIPSRARTNREQSHINRAQIATKTPPK